jgi:hypothetical protein
MEVTEALRTSILEPHDHPHINQIRALAVRPAWAYRLGRQV